MKVLGIDIGGSGIKGAPVDLAKGVLSAERCKIPTPQPATPEKVARTVAEIVQHFKWSGPIGCGLPAVVQNGIARTAANIDKSWIGTNAEQAIAQATACPVILINDADAAGLAEMHYGAGQENLGTVMLVTIGTGLGTALFRNKTLIPNTELGHILLNGKIAEKFASAAARKNEELSYQEWAQRFDLYLHRLQELLWPDLFILGGGVSKKFEKFNSRLTVATEVQPALLRNDAGIVGAALAAQKIIS